MTGEPSSIQMLSKPVRLQNLKAKTLNALENLTSPLMGDPSPTGRPPSGSMARATFLKLNLEKKPLMYKFSCTWLYRSIFVKRLTIPFQTIWSHSRQGLGYGKKRSKGLWSPLTKDK